MSQDVVKDAAAHLATLQPELREAELARLQLLLARETPEDAREVPAPITTLADYLATPIPVPPVLVTPSIVVRGEVTATIGRAGKGKTTINVQRMMRWAAGLPLFDDLPDVLAPPDARPLRTLIIENEGSAGMFQEAMQKRLGARTFITEEQSKLVAEHLLIWGDGGWQGIKLDDPETFRTVQKGLEHWKPDIVLIEPFRGLWRGNENDSTEMSEIVDRFAELARDYQCGIVISHHERKSGTGEDGEGMSAARGSGVLEGYAAVMESFGGVKSRDQKELDWTKSRYYKAPPPIRMEYEEDSGVYRYIPPAKGLSEVLGLLAEAEGGLTVKGVAEELSEKERRVRDILNELVDDGQVRKSQSSGSGFVYRLVRDDAGEGLGF